MSFLTEFCMFLPDVWYPIGTVDHRLKASSCHVYVELSVFLLRDVLCVDNRDGMGTAPCSART